MSGRFPEREQRVRDRLGEFYHPDEVEAWLHAPHPQFGGRTALDMIHEGRSPLVHQVIDRLDADAYL